MYSTDNVWLWGGGGGVLSCVVDHILQEFNTLFLTRFRTYKIATPHQTKPPVKTTFRDWCLCSSFVHGAHTHTHMHRSVEMWNPLIGTDCWLPFREYWQVRKVGLYVYKWVEVEMYFWSLVFPMQFASFKGTVRRDSIALNYLPFANL